jgi:hypothetical protein
MMMRQGLVGNGVMSLADVPLSFASSFPALSPYTHACSAVYVYWIDRNPQPIDLQKCQGK